MKASRMRIFVGSVVSALMLLTGCSTIYSLQDRIPGLDRVINKSSKAEVGPVKDQTGAIVPGTESTIASTDNLTAPVAGTQEEPAAKQVTPPEKPQDEPAKTSSKPLQRLATVPKIAQRKEPQAMAKGQVSGSVTLLTKNGSISPKGVIVRLNRADGKPLMQSNKQTVRDIDMQNKIYAPGNMVISKGDTLNFVNKDPIQHNVFSSSGENAFDLGTFGEGLQRTVKLNKEGVVKVYCNIHPGMATYVAVDDKGLSQIIENKNGFFAFNDLPKGEYLLTLWSIRGEKTQPFIITSDAPLTIDIDFDTRDYKPLKRLDKFGKTVEKRKVRQEFY